VKFLQRLKYLLDFKFEERTTRNYKSLQSRNRQMIKWDLWVINMLWFLPHQRHRFVIWFRWFQPEDTWLEPFIKMMTSELMTTLQKFW